MSVKRTDARLIDEDFGSASATAYLSTFDFRAIDAPLSGKDVARWYEMIYQAGIQVPLFLIHDLAGILTDALAATISHHLADGPYEQSYVKAILNIAISDNISKINHAKLEPAVMGSLLVKLLKNLDLKPYPFPPPPAVMSYFIEEVYQRDQQSMLNIVRWDEAKIYPPPRTMDEIAERINKIDLATLITANALGVGSELKVEKLGSLLQELAKLPEEKEILSLVMRLMPLLNLSSWGAGSQTFSLGGYNDISRHGDLHSILISELAYPEEEFLRRFVENELLYYKREAPPDPRPRTIIYAFDAGPNLWGSARLIAVAAAIALALQAERRKDRFIWISNEQLQPRQLISSNDLRELIGHRNWEMNFYNCLLKINELLDDQEQDYEVILAIANDFDKWDEEKDTIKYLVNNRPFANYFALQSASNSTTLSRWHKRKEEFQLLRSVEIPLENLQRAVGITVKQSDLVTPEMGIQLNYQAFINIGHVDRIKILTTSSDSKYLVTTGEDLSYRLWLLKDGQMIWFSLGEEPAPTAITFSPTGNQLAEGHANGLVFIREVPGRDIITKFNAKYRVKMIAFSPDGKFLAIATKDDLQIWQLPLGNEPLKSWDITEVLHLGFSHNNEYIIVINNGECQLIRIGEFQESKLPFINPKIVVINDDMMVRFCRNNVEFLRINTSDQWEMDSIYNVDTPFLDPGKYYLSSDGNHLFIMVAENRIDCHNLAQRKLSRSFFLGIGDRKIERFTVNEVAKLIVTSLNDGAIYVQQWIDGKILWHQAAQERRNLKLSCTADAKTIAISDSRWGNYIWQLDKMIKPTFDLKIDEIDKITQLKISPNGQHLIAISEEKSWLINNYQRGEIKVKEIPLKDNVVIEVSIQSLVAAINSEHKMEIYNAENGRGIYIGNAIPNRHLISFEAERIAYLETAETVAVFDLPSMKIVFKIKANKLLSLKLSEDGNRVYLLSTAGTFETWNIGGERIFSQVLDLQGHSRAKIVDNSRVALYGKDKNLILINRISGTQLKLTGHLGNVLDCTATDKLIITTDRIGMVRLFSKIDGTLILTLYVASRERWIAFRCDSNFQAMVGQADLLQVIPFPIQDYQAGEVTIPQAEHRLREMIANYQV